LLSEALQEQSRWIESLQYLDQIQPLSDPGVVDTAFILKTKAQRRLGLVDLKDLGALPGRLLGFIRAKPDASTTIQAAVEAASILETLRSNSVVPEIQECLAQLKSEGLGLDDTAHLLLAKSMLHYQMRNLPASLQSAREAIDLLEGNNHPSSVLAMLQNGLGAILTKQGFYADSVREYLKCYNTSYRIGHDRIWVQASANLSLSFMRLGEYHQAIIWGERSLSDALALVNMGCGFQGAEGSVFSYAMTGTKLDRAEELILQTRNDLTSHAPFGVAQAWALYSADAYAMMGRTQEAEEEGRRGTEGVNDRLWMDFYAGSYARWVARLSLSKSDRSDDYKRLKYLQNHLSSYDALDQAEILNAKCWLDSYAGGMRIMEVDAMRKCLGALPQAVSEQLKRMRMLDFLSD
jgi:hypothetical protein